MTRRPARSPMPTRPTPGLRSTRAQVINMVERRPSGAMTYGLEPGSDDIEPDLRPTVVVIADGPLRVTVQLADGTILETRNRVTLCRCGASKNKPLCDGTH